MMEVALASLRDFASTVRWADMVDVALAAGFFFVIISWLRRSVSRGALIVVAAVAVVYVLARLMSLYLMEMLIRGLFVVFLLASVVVFQADIRRFIDRVGAWSRGAGGNSGGDRGGSAAVDTLAEAAFRMGNDRTGALIAVRGHEPWERHVEGGVRLGGRLSLPLLYSLFHHHSPGHDGAMLLEGGTVASFGAHLALSTNLSSESPYGTRHAAALGLSEVCDALIIVVSEERGEVSVAQDGRLAQVDSASELKRRLSDFWTTHYEDRADGARPAWWNRRTLQTAALSASLAALAWLLFAHQSETVYRTVEVPVEFRNLPDGWAAEEPEPAAVQVTLSGSAQAFQLLDVSNLVLSFNLEDVRAGEMELVVEEGDLNLPDNIGLYRAEPGSVVIQVQQAPRSSGEPSARAARPPPSRMRLLAGA